jgi:hypothetical protein
MDTGALEISLLAALQSGKAYTSATLAEKVLIEVNRSDLRRIRKKLNELAKAGQVQASIHCHDVFYQLPGAVEVAS